MMGMKDQKYKIDLSDPDREWFPGAIKVTLNNYDWMNYSILVNLQSTDLYIRVSLVYYGSTRAEAAVDYRIVTGEYKGYEENKAGYISSKLFHEILQDYLINFLANQEEGWINTHIIGRNIHDRVVADIERGYKPNW